MTRALLFLLCTLFVLPVWAETHTEQPKSPNPEVSKDLTPAIAMAHRVKRMQVAFLSGDDAAIRDAIQECDVLVRTYNATDLTPLVEAMVLWALEQGKQGHPGVGLRVLVEMERWHSNDPTIIGARIALMRRQGPGAYLKSLLDVMDLTRIRITHPENRWIWIAQHAAWLRTMATLLLWGLTLAMVLRYRNALRYIWEDPLRKKGLSALAMALLGAFMLASPVILGLDPSVSCFLALWLAAPFLSAKEVKVIYVVVLLQLAHPAFSLLDNLGNHPPPRHVSTLQRQPQWLPWENANISKLPPSDRRFLDGWRQIQAQDWQGASVTFAELMEKSPNNAAAINNRGVALYQLGKLEEATKAFDDAAAIRADSVEILLNQSVMAFRRLDSVLGVQKQDEARKLDPDLFTTLANANHVSLDQRTFAMPLADDPMRDAALKDTTAASSKTDFGKSSRKIRLIYAVTLPLLLLLMMAFRVRRSIRAVHPTQCARCGEPFHTTDSPESEICSQCHHLFVLKDGLHGDRRKQKVDDVSAFQSSQRWIHRSLIVLTPGLDRCFLGRVGEGILEFGFICFAAGILFATGPSVRYPGEILADPRSIWTELGLVLLGILFLRSWIKLFSRRTVR